ncbi:hypothetical protein ACFQPF_15325 [Fictibacillus iocasae]|uniref:G5 domain-containing protein n=1 Tax=Fictibacillus iocasae TaxID=2715437 RepID=A0ABW2NTA5_9BACL
MAKQEFNPKRFLQLFGTIGLSSFFIFSTSTIASQLYSNTFAEKKLGMGASVASVSLENLTKEEAATLLQGKIEKWRSSSEVVLIHNEERKNLPLDAWQFQPEESIQAGRSQPLKTELNENLVKEALQTFSDPNLEKVLDMPLLLNHLKQSGSQLTEGTIEVQLGDFLSTAIEDDIVVSEIALPLKGEYRLLTDYVAGLNGFKINGGESFSLRQALEEVKMTPQISPDLNALAEGIHRAALTTNFSIVERHTSRELHVEDMLGYEVSMDDEERDLILHNPNTGTYELSLVVVDQVLSVSFVGVPFPYTYKTIVEKKTFEPKTIVQFSKELSSFNSISLKEEGREGYLAAVYRISYDNGGRKTDKVKLYEDFYPPKHRIEERGYPLAADPVEGIPPEAGDLPPALPWYPPYPYPENPENPETPADPETGDEQEPGSRKDGKLPDDSDEDPSKRREVTK